MAWTIEIEASAERDLTKLGREPARRIVKFLRDRLASSAGALLPREIPTHTAALSYFSLTTITTTGFGDLVPVDPIARSLANLESVFGHLFPATLLARLVALHVAHGNDARPSSASRVPTETVGRRARRRSPYRLAS